MIDLKPGQVGWMDITVPDADALKDFYKQVVGWKADAFDMGGYNDYCMVPPGADAPVAGICHAQGANAGLPPQWVIYITVADLDASLRQAQALGGALLAPVREGGGGKFGIIRDPAGALCALYQKVPEGA